MKEGGNKEQQAVVAETIRGCYSATKGGGLDERADTEVRLLVRDSLLLRRLLGLQHSKAQVSCRPVARLATAQMPQRQKRRHIRTASCRRPTVFAALQQPHAHDEGSFTYESVYSVDTRTPPEALASFCRPRISTQTIRKHRGKIASVTHIFPPTPGSKEREL